MKKVAVIGSIATDFVVSTKTIPQTGETVVGESFQTFFGGKGANQAIALKRSGMDVYMIGAVGKDHFGVELINNLKNNGIHTEMIHEIDDTTSGSAHIQLMDGDNRIIIVPGANNLLSINNIKQHQEELRQMDMVVFQNEIPMETIHYIIDFCFENKIETVYNPAPAKEIDTNYLNKVTYITPNEHEAKLLFKDESLSEVLKKYHNKLIVTLGDKGAIFHDGKKEIMVSAKKVTNVVDTTGAGDTFNGYLTKGILKGHSLQQSVNLGNTASAQAIQTKGAQDGIPTYEKVVEML